MLEDDLDPGAHSEPIVVRTPPQLRHRGKFMASLKIRPTDGGPVQEIEGIADTEDYARAEAYQRMDAALRQVQTMAPDTPAVRTFIEAASHMHDLRQALGALESAEELKKGSVSSWLRIYAVVAYGRTYGSHARPDLAAFVELSPSDVALTARLRVTRNKYAAHSENAMTVTKPILDLQQTLDGDITIKQVSGITLDSPMPISFVAEFTEMLWSLVERLTAALQPMKDAVRRELTREEVANVFDNPQPLQLVTATVEEWEPDGRRPAYPSSRFTQLHIDRGEGESTNVSITR